MSFLKRIFKFKSGEQKIVLSFFDLSTNFVMPWASNGFLCYCVDLAHPQGESREGNIIKLGMDVRGWMSYMQNKLKLDIDQIAFTAWFPPCTDLAISGARWWKEKMKKNPLFQLEAMDLVWISGIWADMLGAPYLIENPVGKISKIWRKPDYIFQPWQYGDNYTKKTCLWVGNGFVMPEPIVKKKPENCKPLIHHMGPIKNRSQKRAETPPGFAREVFEANHKGGLK